MERTLLWLGLIIGILSGVASLWKDWKHKKEPDYKKSNGLAIFLFSALCCSLLLTTITGNIALKKQAESDAASVVKDSLNRTKDSLNKKLSDSLLISQNKLARSQSDLTRLALNQLDTLRSVAYLSQKLNDAQGEIITSQNIMHNEIIGTKGFCYLIFDDEWNFGRRGIIVNKNAQPIYNVTVSICELEGFLNCIYYPFTDDLFDSQFEPLSKYLDTIHLNKITSVFHFDELRAYSRVPLHYDIPYAKDDTSNRKYIIKITTRANSYTEELIADRYLFTQAGRIVYEKDGKTLFENLPELHSWNKKESYWNKEFNYPKKLTISTIFRPQ